MLVCICDKEDNDVRCIYLDVRCLTAKLIKSLRSCRRKYIIKFIVMPFKFILKKLYKIFIIHS